MPKNQDTKEDKNQLKRAALFYWAHSIYLAAENAATAVGGFEKTPTAGAKYKCIVKKMKAFIRELEAIAAAKECKDEAQAVQPVLPPPPVPPVLPPPTVPSVQPPPPAPPVQPMQPPQAEAIGGAATAAYSGYGCEMSEDCPDGQICVDNHCESPFG